MDLYLSGVDISGGTITGLTFTASIGGLTVLPLISFYHQIILIGYFRILGLCIYAHRLFDSEHVSN